MAGGGTNDGSEPEFQVAPMVDVLLTILVFFMMITSAQVLKVDKRIELPVAPDAQKKDNARAEIIVNVRWTEASKTAEFVVNDRVYQDAADMVGVIETAKQEGEKKIAQGENPAFRAVIRGDRQCPAIHISKAMEACAQAGISDISFSTVNKS